MFREFEEISINKSAKDRAKLLKIVIPEFLQIQLDGIYKNFGKRLIFTKPF